MLNAIMNENGTFVDFLDPCLETLAYLTYHSGSPALWNTFPMMVYAFDNFAFAQVEDMIVPIRNLIALSPETFLSPELMNLPAKRDDCFAHTKGTVNESPALQRITGQPEQLTRFQMAMRIVERLVVEGM